jgi:hypothetical protein
MFWCPLALPTAKGGFFAVSESCTSLGYIQGVNRHDVRFFPARLDDDIAEDNPARFRETVVEALDLAACGGQRAGPAATGLCPGRSLDALPLRRSRPPAFESSP